MDELKNSFLKVKEDFLFLKEEISYLRGEIEKTKELVSETCFALSRLDSSLKEVKEFQTQKEFSNTEIKKNPTDNTIFTPGKGQIYSISTGNRGVQTDRQTDRQTDKSPQIKSFASEERGDLKEENSFDEAIKALNSLDLIKKELRLKFKRLTSQEILVFSAIYQMEEEKGYSDYKTLSSRLNLTESSIRDYVRRLILKEIPLTKRKENNKEIKIYISENLKKIASLDTLLKLINL